MIRKEYVMAGTKTKKNNGNKTPKRPKNYEPGFFNDYGGSGIIITKRPKKDKK